ncbi:DUF389 domain-containing protein [Nakamurella antarctica]|uniref:DUF389 domain-containing protein n=1 Tax=Nakamurella antarctica TaxID=1902245 RepID=A0A3G8ZQX9_9ACTN|nr:DUF389 domain-containing protein [Nakamurella antarctica]AZI59639.1 DUF389 domain-containing protein [Nakamurella antarctica]
MHLRLIVPPAKTVIIETGLLNDARITNLVVLRGAAQRPPGDVVLCDVTREAVQDLLTWLRSEGIYEAGSVTLTHVDAAPSPNHSATEVAAVGAPDDAIIFDQVLDTAYNEARGSWAYYVFFSLATLLAAVAVITDSSVLVVGAMVVGPEFGLIAAIAIGAVMGRYALMSRALWLLLKGFAVAIVVTTTAGLLARWIGWISEATVAAPRPLTGFIWSPDKWSAVVAVLAGCAGVLSHTAGKSTALVGVFISVTTVPAAGDFALSLAVWETGHLGGAAAQLGINLLGLIGAGILTLLLQRTLWSRVRPYRRSSTLLHRKAHPATHIKKR